MTDSGIGRAAKLLLTSDEAVRALYCDFEGLQNKPPSFVGVRMTDAGGDFFEQTVLDPLLARTITEQSTGAQRWPKGYDRLEPLRLNPCAVRREGKALNEFVAELVGRAERENRLIVSWSRHEPEIVAGAGDIPDETKDRFISLWRDAKYTARRWKARRHRAAKFVRLPGRGTHRLENYFGLIGYEIPAYFGDRQAAQRISYVRGQLEKKGSFASLTAVAKAKWTKVLNYNWHDCNGMREVALIAAGQMRGLERGPSSTR